MLVAMGYSHELKTTDGEQDMPRSDAMVVSSSLDEILCCMPTPREYASAGALSDIMCQIEEPLDEDEAEKVVVVDDDVEKEEEEEEEEKEEEEEDVEGVAVVVLTGELLLLSIAATGNDAIHIVVRGGRVSLMCRLAHPPDTSSCGVLLAMEGEEKIPNVKNTRGSGPPLLPPPPPPPTPSPPPPPAGRICCHTPNVGDCSENIHTPMSLIVVRFVPPSM